MSQLTCGVNRKQISPAVTTIVSAALALNIPNFLISVPISKTETFIEKLPIVPAAEKKLSLFAQLTIPFEIDVEFDRTLQDDS